MKSGKPYLSFIVAALLLSIGLFACEKGPGAEQEISADSPASGTSDTDSRITELLAAMNMYNFSEKVKAPDFELSSVNGGKSGLARYRGKIVLLSFWATW